MLGSVLLVKLYEAYVMSIWAHELSAYDGILDAFEMLMNELPIRDSGTCAMPCTTMSKFVCDSVLQEVLRKGMGGWRKSGGCIWREDSTRRWRS